MSAVLAEQGSAMWLEQRHGKLTASRVSDAFARLKSGDWAASRSTYMLELLAERLTGLAAPHYISREMLEGIEQEPAGIAAYEFDREVQCEPMGFVDHPTIAMAGASPDRSVGLDGLVEMKAPKTSTYLAVRLEKEFGVMLGKKPSTDSDDGYLLQSMWQLACTRREWCDLVYYDPRMAFGQQLFVRRIERDDKIIAAMEAEARVFLDQLAELEARFR